MPPVIHILNTYLPNSHATLLQLIGIAEEAYLNYEGSMLNDEVVDLWEKLESEYIWLLGPDEKYRKVINRSGFEVTGSKPAENGRRPLATEAPNPSMFAMQVCSFVKSVIDKSYEIGANPTLSNNLKQLWRGSGAYASD